MDDRELFRKGQIDWAAITLKKPNIQHSDGRMSHQNALEVLKKVEEERLKAMALQEKREPLIEAAKKMFEPSSNRVTPEQAKTLLQSDAHHALSLNRKDRKAHYKNVQETQGQKALEKLVDEVRKQRTKSNTMEM